MFGNLGLPELAIIVLFGLVIFGPDRLPKAASDAAQMIKKLRAMSHAAMDDFRADLGPEFQDLDIRSLHPRRIVEDAWHSWDEQTADPEGTEEDKDGEPTPSPTTAAAVARKARPKATPKTHPKQSPTRTAARPRSRKS